MFLKDINNIPKNNLVVYLRFLLRNAVQFSINYKPMFHNNFLYILFYKKSQAISHPHVTSDSIYSTFAWGDKIGILVSRNLHRTQPLFGHFEMTSCQTRFAFRWLSKPKNLHRTQPLFRHFEMTSCQARLAFRSGSKPKNYIATSLAL